MAVDRSFCERAREGLGVDPKQTRATNEVDIGANLVDPQLWAAGWTDREVTGQLYYQRDQECAPGRIIPVGNETRRGTPQSKLPSSSHKSDLQRLEQGILDGAFRRSCDGV